MASTTDSQSTFTQRDDAAREPSAGVVTVCYSGAPSTRRKVAPPTPLLFDRSPANSTYSADAAAQEHKVCATPESGAAVTTPPEGRTNTRKLAWLEGQIVRENYNRHAVQALDALAPLPAPPRRTLCKIGLVAASDTVEGFGHNALVMPLQREHWRSQLQTQRPHFVLVESDFLDCCNPWRHDIFSLDRHTNQIQELVEFCGYNDVPCAFWFTLEKSQIHIFEHLIGCFETVFVAEPDCFAELAKQHGTRKVHRLAPCFEPRIYNPARPEFTDDGRFGGEMPVTADCLAALMFHDRDQALLNNVQQCLDYKLWLYDSDDFLRPRESFLPAHFLRRSLGTVSRKVQANILKLSEVSLCLQPRLNSSYWRHQSKVLQSLASRSLTLSDASIDASTFDAPLSMIFDKYLHAADSTELREKLTRILLRKHLRERLQHLFFRQVMLHHTFRCRIAEVADVFGLESISAAARQRPKVTMIAPMMRPENFEYTLQLLRSQTYINKEIFFVLNTDVASADTLRRRLRDDDNARLLCVPSRWPIGVCLNSAVLEAGGEYWAKIDDDDFYGPRYIEDFILNTNFVDFDIAGKPGPFTYDERGDQMVRHRNARHSALRSEGRAHMPASNFAGGSLFVKNVSGSELLFPERTRGLADVYFQWHYLEAGAILYASDPFNFVQFRRADRLTHTWRIEIAQMSSAEPLSRGLNLEVAVV